MPQLIKQRLVSDDHWNLVREATSLTDLPDGVCPLALPALVPHRDQFVKRLNDHGIAAFPFWSGYHRDFNLADFPEATWLKDNVLTLPIHRQLGPRHLKFIAGVVAMVASALADHS